MPQVLSGALRDPSGSVDSNAVGRMWEAFGHRSRPIPRAFLGTVLVSCPGRGELVVDDAKTHHNFERQIDLVHVLDYLCSCCCAEMRSALIVTSVHFDVVCCTQLNVGLAQACDRDPLSA